MARDATARLYDVDLDSVEFKKLDKSDDYDQGEVTFRARPGKLIDLDKLHESIWATRLSGGTRSGLVSLRVTAVGALNTTGEETVLHVPEADAEFVLRPHPEEAHAPALSRLLQATKDTDKEVRVTGVIDNYRGYWPNVLRQQPSKPRHILVTDFDVTE